MAEYKLIEGIIERSEADNWDDAKLEWELQDIYREDEPDTCLCGHTPINEICLIRNKENGQQAIVGNVCVKKFMEHLPSDLIFQAIKRISDDEEAALNAEAIRHAHKKGWINEWELNFSLDTKRKRKLSGKQKAKRLQINAKVLHEVVNSRGR